MPNATESPVAAQIAADIRHLFDEHDCRKSLPQAKTGPFLYLGGSAIHVVLSEDGERVVSAIVYDAHEFAQVYGNPVTDARARQIADGASFDICEVEDAVSWFHRGYRIHGQPAHRRF